MHEEWLVGEPCLVESVWNLHVLLCSLAWVQTAILVTLSLQRRLTLKNTHLIGVPNVFEVLHPVGCDLALLEQVVSALDLGVDGFSCLDT